MAKPSARVGFIVGSHRQNSQSTRVSGILKEALGTIDSKVSSYTLDLAGNPLPLWDEEMWASGETKWSKLWQPISKELSTCTSFVVISPEWSGMVPPGLKNFFLLCSQGELSHKPGLIVTLSSTAGGAYPVSELRSSSYKNTRICYLPEHLILREVENLFHEGKDEKFLRSRLNYSLRLLLQYDVALRTVRESGLINDADFPYGM